MKDSSETQDDQKPKKSSLFRKVGGAAFKTVGFDVLKKDLSRVRPRNPELWRQLFSAEGLDKLKEKVSGSGSVSGDTTALSEKEKQSANKKNLVNSTLTAVLAFLAGIYLVVILSSTDANFASRFITALSGLVFVVIALVYGYIAIRFAIAVSKNSNTPHSAVANRPGMKKAQTKKPEATNRR